MKKISLKEGDRLCTTCYDRERGRFDKLYTSRGESMDMEDESIEDNEDSIDISENAISFRYFISSIFFEFLACTFCRVSHEHQ